LPATARHALPYPNGSDDADVPAVVQALADALDLVIVSYSEGTIATEPAAGTTGRVRRATDTGAIRLDIGTGWVTLVQSTDARLSDQRVPTDGSVTAAKVAGALKPSGSAAPGTEALRKIGSGAGDAVAGNDARLTDARNPVAHEASHLPSGSDPLATAVPGAIQPDDAAAVGTANSFARSDHKHSIVAAAPGTIQPDDAAAEGAAASFARSDHKHAIAAAAATTLDGTNAEGTSNSFARADHKHAYGAGSIPNSALASSGLGTWKRLLRAAGNYGSAPPGVWYPLREGGGMISAATPSTAEPLGVELLASDLAVSGMQLELKLVAWCVSNQGAAVGPVLNWVLFPLDGVGGSGAGPAWTTPGSLTPAGMPRVTMSPPGASPPVVAHGAAVDAPADDLYGLFFQLSVAGLGTQVVVFNVELLYRYV
jgi:hypothetical protein